MTALLKYEWKSSLKSLIIWTLSVGIMGFVCILLFKSMESNMADMAESFASMGAFSEAFGMNTLSIASAKGFFATEIGTIHALGSSMFAASIAAVILSKEEDGHTAEFTFTLPVSRWKVIVIKYLTVIFNIVVFTLVCGVMYKVGFMIIDAQGIGNEFIIYMLSQLLMSIEIASVCFLLSSVCKKNKLGIGIGIAMILYLYDLMARVIPDLKDYIFISPFSYANATEIFAETADNATALIIGVSVIVITTVLAGVIYSKRDLAS